MSVFIAANVLILKRSYYLYKFHWRTLLLSIYMFILFLVLVVISVPLTGTQLDDLDQFPEFVLIVFCFLFVFVFGLFWKNCYSFFLTPLLVVSLATLASPLPPVMIVLETCCGW